MEHLLYFPQRRQESLEAASTLDHWPSHLVNSSSTLPPRLGVAPLILRDSTLPFIGN